MPILARNLLSSDDCRATLRNEVFEDGPQMALVVKTSPFASHTERLAGTGACPYWSSVRPSGKPGGIGPAAKARKEMALRETFKILWSDVQD
jgi:hypothetical protein